MADPRQGDAKGDALLEMRGIVRRFGDLCANDNIDLDVRRGEILGLLGENGSGKSTLMKVLGGNYPDYDGEIRLTGRSRFEVELPAMSLDD